ncbi:TPA: winged helix-turn-helix transcriptional regulator [Clostridium botulinum]|uniref:ArsR/SmtB family transcription factor n=1 Tax=Clostridium botulinum TaxID=1491 RepID=UPI0015E75D55|nr:metalloregulator ArsR/SmtB family transcription factor [Clostridium botulinum]HDK7164152.1 winged helix-turn-helix transcriptional regulator [Clostridium botulinum]HDK7166111.1 winged helix-turn-helix transcriptional regulator [Clostridium botulinum]HDK7171625.1 winged helix-turn-helix transcriptional regulator [Clostridium botulinum]HDK7182798.1 winged helix-turn-helix transcriptional regulator [Clostridium botulinum]HDK7184628.1 winged helix-turn-helix transcriptional regulator [Clostridi
MILDNTSVVDLSFGCTVFKALGDGTRLGILWILTTSEMCVGDLAQYMSMSNSAISHQLRELRMANLVKNRKVGKKVYYTLKDEQLKVFLKRSFDYANSHR